MPCRNQHHGGLSPEGVIGSNTGISHIWLLLVCSGQEPDPNITEMVGNIQFLKTVTLTFPVFCSQ